MIGACTALNEARISLDVDTEKVWYPNPVLPETRSEMALPLAIGQRVIGAVTVQSVESAAFSDEDVTSLQAMANQLAIAIDNAYKQRQLEEAHTALLRAKTFEAIATATGEAIHWIGNKAEPIAGATQRIRTDLQLLAGAISELLGQAAVPQEIRQHPLVQLLQKESAALRRNNPDLVNLVNKISALPLDQLEQRLSLASMLEDLHIINEAGSLIMKVKEELIGPAREQAPRPTMIDDVVKDAIHSLKLPPGLIKVDIQGNLSLVLADPVQLNRVFVNLIVNAYEAMAEQSKPQITLTIRPDRNGDFMVVEVTDNGSGISETDLDKIWIAFHTNKGLKGHPGLGLPACRLILEQIGGHISATSQLGRGSTFMVSIPIHRVKESYSKEEPGRGKILLIDDNDNWCQFATATLENNGYKVTTSGRNYSIDSFQRFDLILIDDILALGDSYRILGDIRAEGAIAKTVALSSNPRVERAKERKLLGIHNLLAKPYTRAALLGEVRTILNQIRAK
jgi:signal transduction histidine kinase/CheY-like chemotaxis protein